MSRKPGTNLGLDPYYRGRRLKMWELCSGTKTVAGQFKDMGWQTWTIDIEKEFDPDHTGDLTHLDAQDLIRISGFKPDFIWFSPPCTVYSVANLGRSPPHFRQRHDLKLIPVSPEALESNRFILHGIDIINEINPAYFVIENPRGILRTQSMMKQFPRETVTYCQYGFDYMKPTDLWGRFPLSWTARSCRAGSSCHVSSPRGSDTGLQARKGAHARGQVPPALALEIARLSTLDFPMSSWVTLEQWMD